MAGHLFISYSSADGRDFALRLHDALSTMGPPLTPWMDKHGLRPFGDWDDQLIEAIRGCSALLFVMTPDSVEPKSKCKEEWSRALRYKKPVIPLLVTPGIEVPFGLERRQYINSSGDFEPALDQLCGHIKWLSTPAGQLHLAKDRLADARYALRRVSDDAALCGLALCGAQQLIPLATSTYHAARAINGHPGVTKNASRWLDTLAILDNTALLEEARRAAAGD